MGKIVLARRLTSRHPQLSRFLRVSCTVLCVLWQTRAMTLAQAEPLTRGVGDHALPGVDRVGLLGERQGGLWAGLGLGYGYTEDVLGVQDSHHRLGARLSASIAPLAWLAFGGRIEGRYDAHQGGPDDGDHGTLVDSQWVVRSSVPLKPTLHLGGEAVLIFPGAQSAERGLKAASGELHALTTWTPEALTVSGLVGFRLDRARYGVGDVGKLGAADRLALGASDFNALLFGIALSRRTGIVEWLGEWTWDVAVGRAAPSALASPMRVAAGARLWPSDVVQLQALAGVTPSARRGVGAGQALVPIEPRLFVSLGLAMYFPHIGGEPSHAESVDAEGRIVDGNGQPVAHARVALGGQDALSNMHGRYRLANLVAAAATMRVEAKGFGPLVRRVVLRVGENTLGDFVLEPLPGAIRGRVMDAEGHAPIADVTIAVEGSDVTTTSDGQGAFVFASLPPGPHTLHARVEGFQDASLPITVEPGASSSPELALHRELPDGQIRGTIRSFKGKPLVAQIQLKPGGRSVRSNADGSFELDVAPGDYTVVVSAPGYATQTSGVSVEHRGVTVLVVELSGRK